MRTSFVACVLTVTLPCLAAACRSDGDRTSTPASQPASAALDPCTLVTKAEADQALGAGASEPERPSEANMPPRMATCRYVARRGDQVAVLTVTVRTGDSASEARIGFQTGREQPIEVPEAVSNLGEDAFWMANQLHVLKGTRHVIVAGDFDKATGEALAKKVLERLG